MSISEVEVKASENKRVIGLNLALVCGAVSGEPEVRVLESGKRLATFSLRVRVDAEPAVSVPVTVWEPAVWIEDLVMGEEVVVVGRVRRRFFALATGGRGNRVDVEATYVGRAKQKRQLDCAVRRAEQALGSLGG